MKTSKSEDLRTPYPVEFLDMMTDSAVMALVDWVSETKPNIGMQHLVYAMFSLRQMRMESLKHPEGLDEVDCEQAEYAVKLLSEGMVELTGRIWGAFGTAPATKKAASRTRTLAGRLNQAEAEAGLDIEAVLKHSSLEMTTSYQEMTNLEVGG